MSGKEKLQSANETSYFLKPGDPRLKVPCENVKKREFGTDALKGTINTMFDVLIGNTPLKTGRNIAGLHAWEIGIDKNVMIVDMNRVPGKKTEKDYQVFINPYVYHRSPDRIIFHEGCFSEEPFLSGLVERSAHLGVKAKNTQGENIKVDFLGYQARIADHEIKHGEGRRYAAEITDPKDLKVVKNIPEKIIFQFSWKKWPRHVDEEALEFYKKRAENEKRRNTHRLEHESNMHKGKYTL